MASRALASAGVPTSAIDALLLAGGSARLPRVQASLAAICPNASLVFAPVSEEVVCRGAALSGALLRPCTRADGRGDATNAVVMRHLLRRALALELAEGATHTFACAHAPTPLGRTVRFPLPAPPPTDGAMPLLVRLVELPPLVECAGDAGKEDGSDAHVAGGARHVASLPLRNVPPDARALLVHLSVDAVGALELSCDAEKHTSSDGDADSGSSQSGASVRLGSVSAPAPPTIVDVA